MNTLKKYLKQEKEDFNNLTHIGKKTCLLCVGIGAFMLFGIVDNMHDIHQQKQQQQYNEVSQNYEV